MADISFYEGQVWEEGKFFTIGSFYGVCDMTISVHSLMRRKNLSLTKAIKQLIKDLQCQKWAFVYSCDELKDKIQEWKEFDERLNNITTQDECEQELLKLKNQSNEIAKEKKKAVMKMLKLLNRQGEIIEELLSYGLKLEDIL